MKMWRHPRYCVKAFKKYLFSGVDLKITSWNHNITPDKKKNNYFQNTESVRLFSSGTGQIQMHDSHITLNNTSCSDVLNISFIWLRDHCRCSSCYNYLTNQRRLSILDIVNSASIKKCFLDSDTLKITWADNHNSNYSLKWLSKYCVNTPNTEYSVLWNKQNVQSIPIKSIDADEFLHTDRGIKELLTSIIHYGVGFVSNVQPTKEATEQVVQMISHVQRTFFGDMWEFSDSLDHHDTAYTRDALGAHTDNTYFSEAAGLQVLHCLHHSGDGGETLLVDGFNAAHNLKKKHPESYVRLSKVIIESEYKEKGKHYMASGPLLKLNPTSGELIQVRFNMYDRAPLRTVPTEDVQLFYKDFIDLSEIISDPSSEWWFKLNPGTVLFFNNWRVLHGRAAYTGHRKIAGCYIAHSDWQSKARTLGLL